MTVKEDLEEIIKTLEDRIKSLSTDSPELDELDEMLDHYKDLLSDLPSQPGI